MENDKAHMNTHAGARWLNKIAITGSTSSGSQPSQFVFLAGVARSAWEAAFKGAKGSPDRTQLVQFNSSGSIYIGDDWRAMNLGNSFAPAISAPPGVSVCQVLL
jgi:hypothetical protein